ncbi:hypothetical protein A2U01_0048068, partial [Trifolium medium]|nr:hypothetical protein [Trifolium medium]
YVLGCVFGFALSPTANRTAASSMAVERGRRRKWWLPASGSRSGSCFI